MAVERLSGEWEKGEPANGELAPDPLLVSWASCARLRLSCWGIMPAPSVGWMNLVSPPTWCIATVTLSVAFVLESASR